MRAHRQTDVEARPDSRFPQELHARELDMIRDRRRLLADEPTSEGTPPAEAPAEVVGLALSGDGVRSATFNLGVLQGLAAARKLRLIDYLSTAGGGGYAGAFLGRFYTRFVNRPIGAATLIEHKLSDPEAQEIQWLRHTGEYLAPAGQGDTLVNTATTLRNFLAVQFVLTLFVFALMGLANIGRYISFPALVRRLARVASDLPVRFDGPEPIVPTLWVVLLAAITVLWLLPLVIAFWLPSEREAERLEPAVTLAVFVVAGALLIAAFENGSILWFGIVTAAMVMPFVYVEAAWRRIRLRMPGALQHPSTRPMARNLMSTWLGFALASFVVIATFTLVDALGHRMYEWIVRRRVPALLTAAAMVVMVAMLFGPFRLAAWKLGDRMAKIRGGGAVTWARLIGQPVLLPAIFGLLPLMLVSFAAHATYGGGTNLRDGLFATFVALVASVLLGHASARSLVNRTSLLSIYTARIARTYLGASNVYRHATEEGADFTTTQPDDDMSFRVYRPDLAGGPLHLINVFVNETLDQASQRRIRDRQGENMAVGPAGVSIGSQWHGVWEDEVARSGEPTRRVRAIDAVDLPHPFLPEDLPPFPRPESLTLGTWTAISGPAARALQTGRGLGWSLLAGLVNLRTGWWWDSGIETGHRAGEPRPTVTRALLRLASRAFRTQRLLLSEFIGRFAGPWRRFWFLSDAARIDELGAYELIRRRLPVIICSDSTQAVGDELDALGTLIRTARIDLGAEIVFLTATDIAALPIEERDARNEVARPGIPQAVVQALGSLDDLRAGPDGLARKHAAIARIYYDGSRRAESVFLYLKATVTGDESPDVGEYQRRNPAFPNESPLDQSFNEAQWESYRKLGAHCVGQMFGAGVPFWIGQARGG